MVSEIVIYLVCTEIQDGQQTTLHYKHYMVYIATKNLYT